MYMCVRYLGNVMYAPCSIHVRVRETKPPYVVPLISQENAR